MLEYLSLMYIDNSRDKKAYSGTYFPLFTVNTWLGDINVSCMMQTETWELKLIFKIDTQKT